MDFVVWCSHVLNKIIELSISPKSLTYGYVTDSMLGEALFGEEMTAQFIGSTLRARLHTAIDELERSHLVIKKRLGQMYKIEFTPLGRACSTDITPVWKEIFAVTLRPDAESLLRLVNSLSQKVEADYVWLEDVRRERFHELGWGDKQKRLLAIRELEHHGLVRSHPALGSELDLTATYRGIVWETRHASENFIEPESAHVLFTDIVGYSKLSMDEQTQLRARLKEVVRVTETYRRAQANEKLISRSTGDGMALVFFGHPAAPVDCAIEISRALRTYPELKLRMGAHTGPVRRDKDINDQIDVAGGGINFAQRVMDAGDAGHILLSKAVSENLLQLGGWSNYLHDLGEIEVKHGARVHIFNLYGDDFGNSEPPEKFGIVEQPNRHGVPTRDLPELRDKYREVLRRVVSKVRLFGNDRTRELNEVFVTLSIVEEDAELLSDRRLMGLMDAGLRRKLSIFTYDSDESYGYSVGGREKMRTVMPDELLREGRQAVVTGAPGCGKTTLLKYLALKADQKEPNRWVVFLELKTVQTEDLKVARNLQELLFAKAVAEQLDLNEAEREKLRRHFFASLQEGNASLFLDGLDEVRHQSLFSDLCSAVSEFGQDSNFRRNTLILSTRPFGLHRAPLGDLQQMEIQPLDQKQVESFLRSYYPDDETAQKLARDLRKPGDLRELAGSPAMLAGIIELYRENNAPVEIANRLDIYEKITRRLIAKLDLEKNAPRYSFRLTDPDGTLKRDFLERLAFERLLLDKNDTDTEASRFIFSTEDLLAKAKAFVRSEGLHDITPHTLADDVKASAMLREVSEGKYAFAHTTLQEYLAAKMLARYEGSARVFAHIYFNYTLVAQEILPMTLGLVAKADELYEVLERLPESLTLTNLRLQLRGLSYAASISQDKFTNLLDRTAQFLIDPSNEEEAYRHVILRSLWFLTDRAREYLEEKILPQLTGWSSIDKIRVVEALAVIGSEKSIDPLIRVLDPHMSEGDLDSRIIFASSSWDSHTVHAICHALARISPQKAVPVLAAVNSSYTSGEIEWMLQRIGTEEANKAILVRRTRGSDWRSTQAARELIDQSKNQGVAEVLVMALHHRDGEIRSKVVEILGTIGLEKYVMPITECLRDPYHPVRWNAAFALQKIRSLKAVDPLIEALRDNNSDVRWCVALALGTIGSEKAVEGLLACLDDPSPEVRYNAASSLGWIRDERAVVPLLKLLAKESVKPRRAAAFALGNFKDQRVIKELVHYLADADQEVRTGVAYSLGKIRSEDTVDLLIEKLADDSPEVRRGAAFALGLIGSEKAIPHLLSTMRTDKDHQARESALEALGNIGAVEAIEPLMIAHTNGFGFDHAAKALSQIKSSTLAIALPRLLLHENKLVRIKVAQVISYYCDSPDVIDEISRLAQSDPEDEVRAAAKKTINIYEYKSTLLSLPASS